MLSVAMPRLRIRNPNPTNGKRSKSDKADECVIDAAECGIPSGPPRYRCEEVGANVSHIRCRCEQADLRRGMVTRGERSGTGTSLKPTGRGKHETHSGGAVGNCHWAYGWTNGRSCLRERADHGH